MPSTERQVDGLEMIPENFADFGGLAPKALDACRERFPVRAHGVATNLGGLDPLDADWLRRLKRLLDHVKAPCFSDHACFTAHQRVQSHDLLPLPFTEASAEHLGRRTREVSDRLERPMLLENITYYARMPGSTLTEPEWLERVLEISGAELLLDLNNLYLNAKNHGVPADDGEWVDPDAGEPGAPSLVEWLERFPLHRVSRIHLAGFSPRGEVLLDTHGGPVEDPVLALYRQTLRRIGPVETIVEWDNHVPDIDVLLDEADRVRAAARAALTPALDTPSLSARVEAPA